MSVHICDCGEQYSSSALVLACAERNHGHPRRDGGMVTTLEGAMNVIRDHQRQITRLTAERAELAAEMRGFLTGLSPIVNEFHNGKVNGGWPPTRGDMGALAREIIRMAEPVRAALAKAGA